MKGRSVEELRHTIGPDARRLRGLVRRMAIKVTSRALWHLTGHTIGATQETADAPTFSGVGFYARPKVGARAEAIVLAVGEADQTVIVATRDEDLRKLWADQCDADSAAMFNRSAGVVVSGATVEVRSRLGVAQPTVRGQTYRAAEDTLLTALSTLTAAIAVHCAPTGASPDPTLVTACATFEAAITAFQAAAASYLTTVAKVE